ncbi:outer membrane lipoprotein LolB [Lysobacter sp. CW239]|uniref:lipoprotein insertase outer membrane protein LolB n=1 Tax=Lysobacteraceae TaxID=32033 RepID=UPI0006916076|nr:MULTISPECIES: lipoprotein insertase outer membrane protein LolB [Lysobacter]QOD91575.1 outer membrane lipoprotein LolB [Lysobacter sp. CW239]
MTGRLVAVAALALLLAACAGAPVRPELTPAALAAAEAAQAGREQALGAQSDWSLAGRIAVSNQGKGGSGRIEWTQAGPDYRITLSAPVTRQGWQLSGNADSARLEGLEGGPRSGPDAQALLLAATGWDIPVDALAQWVRGARAPALGPARIDYGSDGLPWRIRQAGWSIEYRWPPADPAMPAAQIRLPSRLDAKRDEAGVRLVVDEWGVDEWGSRNPSSPP